MNRECAAADTSVAKATSDADDATAQFFTAAIAKTIMASAAPAATAKEFELIVYGKF